MFSPNAVFEKCEKFNGTRFARYARMGIFVSVNTNNRKIITEKLQEKLPACLHSRVSLLTSFIGTMKRFSLLAMRWYSPPLLLFLYAAFLRYITTMERATRYPRARFVITS